MYNAEEVLKSGIKATNLSVYVSDYSTAVERLKPPFSL